MFLRTLKSCRFAGSLAALALAAAAPSALGQTTFRVSLGPENADTDDSSLMPVISADGRYVAFASDATTLVPDDTNLARDIFVYDVRSGALVRASVDSAGLQANGSSAEDLPPSISADGRYVAFASRATNLAGLDGNGDLPDVFVRDLVAGTTVRVSVDSGGVPADGSAANPSISADGRYVAFSTYAILAPEDVTGNWDVYVRDLQSGTTTLVSISVGGTQGDDASCFDTQPRVSADGRYVAFDSLASNLVADDTNAVQDVFLRDMQNGTTVRLSLNDLGIEGDDASARPAMSADGGIVAFDSIATNLAPADTNIVSDVFVRDVLLESTTRASVDSSGVQGDGVSYNATISADGRYVLFTSLANLAPGGPFPWWNVFARDRVLETTTRESVTFDGGTADTGAFYHSASADGRFIAFDSFSANLVPKGDLNGLEDVYVRDRWTGFTSLCSPEVDGVVGCPCENPPSAPGKGCDNSVFTGGAVLSATGSAYLSGDTLVFTTAGEKPTATSVLLQGTTHAAAGIVYGQGLRCLGGTLKRLFTKAASGGSITAPEFSEGDPTVSARSAAKGNPISAGQSRWYLVFYRDPIVLGSCPSGSTFNATQTGRIDWSF
jgi:Tol biopolymer transport system component